MEHLTHASAGASLASCAVVWVNHGEQILTAHGALIAAICAIVTTISTVTLGILNYRVNLKRIKITDE